MSSLSVSDVILSASLGSRNPTREILRSAQDDTPRDMLIDATKSLTRKILRSAQDDKRVYSMLTPGCLYAARAGSVCSGRLVQAIQHLGHCCPSIED